MYERYRRAVIAGRALKVTGRVQRESGVTHVIAEHIEDISPMLDELVRSVEASGKSGSLEQVQHSKMQACRTQ